MRRILLVPALLALVASPAAAGDPAAARTHDITREDYFTQAWPTALAVSADGRTIAWTEMRWEDETGPRNTDIWVVGADGADPRRITFDPAADTSPVFSPGGDWIYFSSKRGDASADAPGSGKRQVWRIRPAGDGLMPVTRIKKGVDAFSLSASGRTLYYTTKVEDKDDDPFADLRTKFKDLEYGHGIKEVHELHALDLRTWRSRTVVDERRVITAFTLSPDERRIAMITKPDPTLLSGEGWSRVDVYDTDGEIFTLQDELWREQAPSPYGWIVEPTFSTDGGVLAFRVDFDGYPGEIFLAHLDEGPMPRIQKLIRPDEVTAERGMAWMPGGRTLCFMAEDRARRRIYAVPGIDADGPDPGSVITPGDVVVNSFSFGGEGTLAALLGTPQISNDVFVVERPGRKARLRRVTTINPQVETWKIPQLQIVRWTSEDGSPVEGVLELPPDYRPEDGPLPLVVSIHGGPTSASRYCFQYFIYGRTLFPARGWAVLLPNYRGSTGYGDRFLTDLIGNKNNLDVIDILSGVDALIDRGIADPGRMAVMGWSNGGYLTNCIIARDPRFKAASSGAGVFDSAMQWSIEDTPGHVINYHEGLPWEQPEKMQETSPLYQADRIQTPTLIHVGEGDERVPPAHSRALYRSLRRYLDIPTELVVYPGAEHGLSRRDHREAKLRWDHRWFNHHVLGQEVPDVEF